MSNTAKKIIELTGKISLKRNGIDYTKSKSKLKQIYLYSNINLASDMATDTRIHLSKHIFKLIIYHKL